MKIIWNLHALSESLGLGVNETRTYFKDGRRLSPVAERRIAREILGGSHPGDGLPYDAVDAKGEFWEIRCLTALGIYFCPSYMVGSGRKFDEEGFLKKLDLVKGFVIADAVQFPSVPLWQISSDGIRTLYKSGALGKKSQISRKKFFVIFGKK